MFDSRAYANNWKQIQKESTLKKLVGSVLVTMYYSSASRNIDFEKLSWLVGLQKLYVCTAEPRIAYKQNYIFTYFRGESRVSEMN